MCKKLFPLFCGLLLLGAVVLFSGFAVSASAATVEETSVAGSFGSLHANACPTLSQGSSGTAVRILQSKLNYLYQRYSNPRWFVNSPNDFRPPKARISPIRDLQGNGPGSTGSNSTKWI
jgi:peptidoglycan hydrolase-like protein with peptidoglycan-binding domain